MAGVGMVEGCAWQEGMCDTGGGMCAGETATDGGGTHPTGMHSCSKGNYIEIIYISVNYNKFDLFAKLLVIIHENTQERYNLTFLFDKLFERNK